MSLRLLALDAATDTVHLGLCVGDETRVRALPGGAASSAGLLPALQSVLAEMGVSLRQLDAIAFGAGPGAFTGLRTACSVAQGLAVGAERPLIALDTLAVVADCAAHAGAGDAVWAVQDARMGEVYAACWQRQDGEWTPQGDAALWSPEVCLAAIAERPAALAGNAWTTVPALHAAAQGQGVWADAVPDGASLLRLARAAFARGDFIDPAQALPRYVRNKVAQTTHERAQIAAARAAAA